MARARVIGARQPDAARRRLGARCARRRSRRRARRPRALAGLDACDGPVPVAAALRAAGRWDLDAARDFDADDWWYRCRFRGASGPAEPSSAPLRRPRDGRRRLAERTQHILHSDSMFVAHTVDVGALLRRRQRRCSSACRALAPLLGAARRPRPRWRTRLVAHQAAALVRGRSLLGRMPRLVPAGRAGRTVAARCCSSTVADRRSSAPRCDAGSMARRRGPDAAARCGRRRTGRGPAPTAVRGTARAAASARASGPAALRGRERRADLASRASAAVERWWPHTHGAPALHAGVSVELGGVEETRRSRPRRLPHHRGRSRPDGHGFGLRRQRHARVLPRGVAGRRSTSSRLSAEPRRLPSGARAAARRRHEHAPRWRHDRPTRPTRSTTSATSSASWSGRTSCSPTWTIPADDAAFARDASRSRRAQVARDGCRHVRRSR